MDNLLIHVQLVVVLMISDSGDWLRTNLPNHARILKDTQGSICGSIWPQRSQVYQHSYNWNFKRISIKHDICWEVLEGNIFRKGNFSVPYFHHTEVSCLYKVLGRNILTSVSWASLYDILVSFDLEIKKSLDVFFYIRQSSDLLLFLI